MKATVFCLNNHDQENYIFCRFNQLIILNNILIFRSTNYVDNLCAESMEQLSETIYHYGQYLQVKIINKYQNPSLVINLDYTAIWAKEFTSSILCFTASFLKISVSSRGTSGTTSPARKWNVTTNIFMNLRLRTVSFLGTL